MLQMTGLQIDQELCNLEAGIAFDGMACVWVCVWIWIWQLLMSPRVQLIPASKAVCVTP